MLVWTLRSLERSPAIDEIVVAVHRKDVRATWDAIRAHRFRKITRVVPGGVTRTASVFQGLKALSDSARWVVVHDAARPLVSPELIAATVQAARRFQAAIAAVPVVPTIKKAQRGWVTGTLNRNHLWVVQTPQVFRRDILEEAHEKGRARGLSATDDSALVEALGRRVRIVPGSSRNIKVTTPEDLVIAKALLRNSF